jgi:hypothetical protein
MSGPPADLSSAGSATCGTKGYQGQSPWLVSASVDTNVLIYAADADSQFLVPPRCEKLHLNSRNDPSTLNASLQGWHWAGESHGGSVYQSDCTSFSKGVSAHRRISRWSAVMSGEVLRSANAR